jgi:hypothetical protein
MRKSFFVVTITIGTLFVFGDTCTVDRPRSDNTVPELRWVVRNRNTGRELELVGNATLDVREGESVVVMFKGIDREGLHRLSLGIDSGWSCTNDSEGQQVTPDFPAIRQALEPDNNGHVLTTSMIYREIRFGPYGCPNGGRVESAGTALFGSGENYFSGISTARLTFVVALRQ